MNSLQVQIQNFVDAIFQPIGLFGLCLFVFLIIGVLAWPRTKWWILAFLIFVSTLAYSGQVGLHLIQPVDTFRLYSRPIVSLLLALLIIPVLRSNRGWRIRLVLPGLLIYLGFQLFFSMRFLLFDRDFARGYFGILSYSLIFLVCGFGASRWLQTIEDARSAVRALLLAGAIFTLSSVLQYVIDPSAVSFNGRFIGVSGNSNHAGVLLGLAIPTALYELITTNRRMIWRVGVGALVAMMIVLLVWTGSRTGLLTGLVGTVVLFRLRLGRMAVAILLCGAFAFLLFSLFADAGSMAYRLIDTTDTRSGQWKVMWNDFATHPLFGVSAEEAKWSENSYLLVAARTGIVGLIPFMIGLFLIFGAIVQLQRIRRILGPDILLADLVVSGLCGIAVGAMFEGYLFGTYSYPIFALMLYLPLLAFLLDYCRALKRQQIEDAWQQEELYDDGEMAQSTPVIPEYQPTGYER